jgi:hypothetical protein
MTTPLGKSDFQLLRQLTGSFSNLSTRIRKSAISGVVDISPRSKAFSGVRAVKPECTSAVVSANPAMAAHFKTDPRKTRKKR